MFKDINIKIYNEAYELCKKYDSDTSKAENPYLRDTIEFYSWNKGWNDYYNPDWDN